jgi:rhombotail lipoprotein
MTRCTNAGRTLLVLLLLPLTLSGCAGLGSLCMFHCGSQHSGSTPLVSYLYPDGKVPQQEAVVPLQLPVRVGLAFVPGDGPLAPPDAAQRLKILEGIRDRFRGLDYVRDIVIIPDHYLNGGKGFDSLAQLSRLQGFDLVALVSYDQVSHASERSGSFLYLTVLGAYVINGSRNETHTLLDLAVIEPQSRSLLLRAGGTDAVRDTTNAVTQQAGLRRQQEAGMNRAAAQLGENFSREFTEFSERVKRGEGPVQVVRRGSSGGGGATGALEVLLLSVLVLSFAATSRRAQ